MSIYAFKPVTKESLKGYLNNFYDYSLELEYPEVWEKNDKLFMTIPWDECFFTIPDEEKDEYPRIVFSHQLVVDKETLKPYGAIIIQVETQNSPNSIRLLQVARQVTMTKNAQRLLTGKTSRKNAFLVFKDGKPAEFNLENLKNLYTFLDNEAHKFFGD